MKRLLFLVAWGGIAGLAVAQGGEAIRCEATLVEIDAEYAARFAPHLDDAFAPLVTLEVYWPEERKGTRVRILLDAPMHPNFSRALGSAQGQRLILQLLPEQLESPQEIFLSSEMDEEIIIVTSGSRY